MSCGQEGYGGTRVPLYRALAQAGQHLLGLALLRAVAFPDDLVQQLARPILVAHLLVRLGEIELGGHLLPLCIAAARRRFSRSSQVEADAAEIERRFGL